MTDVAQSTPLFLSDSEDDVPVTHSTASKAAAQRTVPVDVDDLFKGLDDEDDVFMDLAPALDIEALRRQADARHRVQEAMAAAAAANYAPRAQKAQDMAIAGDKENQDGPKKRKPIPKLNDERLLGSHGFPSLIKDHKKFKPMGKGHEAEDLARLVQFYQFWTHKMFPKMQFRDSVERIERVCRSRRMLVSLSVWRDEAKNGPHTISDEDEVDANSDDAVNTAADGQTGHHTSSPPKSSKATTHKPTNTQLLDDDEDAWAELMADLAGQHGTTGASVGLAGGTARNSSQDIVTERRKTINSTPGDSTDGNAQNSTGGLTGTLASDDFGPTEDDMAMDDFGPTEDDMAMFDLFNTADSNDSTMGQRREGQPSDMNKAPAAVSTSPAHAIKQSSSIPTVSSEIEDPDCMLTEAEQEALDEMEMYV